MRSSIRIFVILASVARSVVQGCSSVKRVAMAADTITFESDAKDLVIEKIQKKHIDEEQPQTVDEHFELIMADNTFIDDFSLMTPAALPEWFDETLFKKGQKYYHSNVLSLIISYVFGLIAVFVIPTISKMLTFTKQSSTPCAAFKRYIQTTLHIINLHTYDVMDEKSKFYRTLNTVRKKHSTSSRRSTQSGNFGITQRDMVLTQFGFLGHTLVDSEIIAATDRPREREAFVHFWRVTGYLLGISNRLNLCRKNEHETTLLCQRIKNEVFSKELAQPCKDFYHLYDVALQGLRSIDPTIDTDAFLKQLYELYNVKYEKKLTFYSRCMYHYRKSILYCIRSPYTGWIARPFWNVLMKFLIKFTKNYPILAWLKYGKQESKYQMYMFP